jgi:hypothetical protein
MVNPKILLVVVTLREEELEGMEGEGGRYN